jgi:hypothetical protein
VTQQGSEARQPRALTRAVLVHPDVRRDVASGRWERLAGRTKLVMKALAARGTWHFKGVTGVNRGWRRTGLGGGSGYHFYLWWTAQGSGPGRALPLEPGAVVVRAVRHHDATEDATPLAVGRLEDYERLTEARFELGVEADPWTAAQRAFLRDTSRVRVLNGLPGSGKTTCLWETVERLTDRRVLYLTWSRALAEEARRYFDVHAARDADIEVRAFSEFLGSLLGESVEPVPFRVAVSRLRKLAHASRMRTARLKAYFDRDRAFYFGLMRGWIKGRSLWKGRRVPPPTGFAGPRNEGDEDAVRAWDAHLQEALGRARLMYADLKLSQTEEESLYPEITAAIRLRRMFQVDASRVLSRRWDVIVVDEVQDLTPVELDVVLRVCVASSRPGEPPTELILAGDEGQSVRHTYFEWRELHNQLATDLEPPSDIHLDENQRNPAAIGAALARAQTFYRYLDKAMRPGGQRVERAEVPGDATVCLTRVGDAAEGAEFLRQLAEQTDAAIIHLGEEPPDWATGDELVRDRLRTPAEAKGLEFGAVCVLGAAEALEELTPDLARRDPLQYRLCVNQLRVAMSRATQTLAFLELGDAAVGGSGSSGAVVGPDGTRSGGAAEAELLALVGGATLGPESLLDRLTESDTPPDERLARLVEAARHDMEERPGPAWRTLRRVQALGALEGYRAAWEDLGLQGEVMILLARLSFAEALYPSEAIRADELAAVGGTAIEALGGAPLAAVREALAASKIRQASRGGAAGHEETASRLLRALDRLVATGAELPWLADELGRARGWFGGLLRASAEQAATAGLLAGQVGPWLRVFAYGADEAAVEAGKLARVALDTLIRAGRVEAAMEVLRGLEPVTTPEDVTRKVAVLRGTSRHAEAAALLEASGRPEEAFEAWMDAGDLDEALRVGVWLEAGAREKLLAVRSALRLLRDEGLARRERELLAAACLPDGSQLRRAQAEARALAERLAAGHERLQSQHLELKASWRELEQVRARRIQEVEAELAARLEAVSAREAAVAENELLAAELAALQAQDVAAAEAALKEMKEGLAAEREALARDRGDLEATEAFVMQQFAELEAAERALEPKTAELQQMMEKMQARAAEAEVASREADRKEASVRERERTLALTTAEVEQQRTRLASLAAELGARQAELEAEQRRVKQRQDTLDGKERKAREREATLETRERDLKMRQASLEVRERDLRAARDGGAGRSG